MEPPLGSISFEKHFSPWPVSQPHLVATSPGTFNYSELWTNSTGSQRTRGREGSKTPLLSSSNTCRQSLLWIDSAWPYYKGYPTGSLSISTLSLLLHVAAENSKGHRGKVSMPNLMDLSFILFFSRRHNLTIRENNFNSLKIQSCWRLNPAPSWVVAWTYCMS